MVVSILTVLYNAALLLLLDGDGNGPPAPVTGNRPPPELPLDSALWILLCVGILLGIYFLVKKANSLNSLA